MFERRLKIFLSILLVFVLVLLGRAVQLQIIERNDWRDKAAASLRTETLTVTTRGRILDCKGSVLAEDDPCIDACVDYRFIQDPPDPMLLRVTAEKRLKERNGDEYLHSTATRRKAMVDAEMDDLRNRISTMWDKLAVLVNKDPKEIEERRRSIQQRLTMRRRMLIYSKYEKALDVHNKSNAEPSWYRTWIMGNDSDAPNIDDITLEPTAEETSPQVILEDIDTDTQNELQKHADDYPGLTQVPSTHRAYPYNAAACHVIGRLSKVWQEDIAADPNFGDPLKSYLKNDTKGREGLEALGEPTLRGARGVTVRDGLTNQLISSTPARPGTDLCTTIDIDLQMQIEEMFSRVKVPWEMRGEPKDWSWDTFNMHGAAVVIDIATGDVKALVSAPTYDLNLFEKIYPNLITDRLNAPLLNRATQAMLEPGSTVKPMVGLGAITDGLLGINEGIECTGYLKIGNRVYKGFGKCWTVALGKANGLEFAHHPFPWYAPHQGHDGNADGVLTYSDALERSCNVFFETVADRLKIEGLSKWMQRFGLGRPTGIGIGEARGRLPSSYKGAQLEMTTCIAGIGQGPVAATPLQMCNVAATIARRGEWVRPNLVQTGQLISPFKPKSIEPGDTSWDDIPSRMDLHLNQQALDAAFDGMTRVVNGRAGTGTLAARNDMIVAGKTGTAQATAFFADPPLVPATHWEPQPEHEWYRAIDKEKTKLNHAWFIGFVPADHPQYAISVMVEYGGGGGGAVAGPIASQIIDALVEHGYLHPGKSKLTAASAAQ